MRALILLFALFLPLSAQAEDIKISTITVHGEAMTKVSPDQATLPVTLVSENKALDVAKQEGDEKLRKLLTIAANYGVAKEDMQTEYNSVQPKYDYGQSITTEQDVYTGNISFSFDVTDLAQDKIDAFSEALEKAGLSNIGNNHHRDTVMINAHFDERNEDVKALHEALRQKESEILKLAETAGIGKSKISRNSNESKGKERHSNPRERVISGYQSTMNVTFLVKDKEKVTPLINAIVKEGVDTIGSVTFSLGSGAEKEFREETLLKALKDANEKAHKLAEAAGMTLANPLAIEEGSGGVQPPPFYPRPMLKAAMAMDAAKLAPPSPDLPSGQTEIHQSVTVTYALK